MNGRMCFASMALICFTSMYVSAQSPLFTWASPRSMALGGVSTTGFDESATMHLNPASLVEIERFTVSSGISGYMSDHSVDIEGQDSIDNSLSPSLAPHLTAAINFGSRLACAGISLNTFDCYRLSLPSDGSTRYQGTDLTLYSGGLDLALGFMPIRDLSFGFKLGLMGASAQWNRSISPLNNDPDPVFDMDWELDMTAVSDYSLLAGVIWSPAYRFKAGLTYRPEMRYRFDGTISTQLPEIMGGEVIRSDCRTVTVTIPQEIRLGCHWVASERVDLYADMGWTGNSSIDTVNIKADDPKPPFIDGVTSIPMRQKDVWHGHVGAEYVASGFVTLRAGGFYYSDSGRPQYESSLIPESAHWGITSGVGFHFFEWDIDAMAGYVAYDPATITGTALSVPLAAEVTNAGYVSSVSFRYHF